MCLAVIPARGGSKRVPRKNVRPFAGKPMLAWPVAAALACGLFDRVLVSTDDANIAAVAEAAGATAPFLRPADLSGDHVPTRAVIRHAIVEAERLDGAAVDYVCCILATAPFVRPGDIREGFDLLRGGPWAFVLTVAQFTDPIQRAFRRLPTGGLEMFYPEHRLTRSQDLEPAYHDAGQFYWGTREAFFSDRPMFGPESAPLILPRDRVIDIDTEEDWMQAQRMFLALGAAENPGERQ